MKEQLIRYVDLLFAGAPDAAEIKQEILQNTLDRYDDLILQGKSPQAAYSLSISGIGDVSELLDRTISSQTVDHTPKEAKEAEPDAKKLRALSIALYILCPIPLFIFSEFGSETLGLCFTLLLVATATALIIIAGKSKPIETSNDPSEQPLSPENELRNSVRSAIWAVGVAVYAIVSFITGAWYLTWLFFPLIGCISGLVNACMDLKEAR